LIEFSNDTWKHKDSKAKTHYRFNELTGAVESRVYNSEGTLVRYNGKHLADNNIRELLH
jgi:hypothetical protein